MKKKDAAFGGQRLWGDGFHDDTVRACIRSRSIDEYDDDELVCYFPNMRDLHAPALSRFCAMIAARVHFRSPGRPHAKALAKHRFGLVLLGHLLIGRRRIQRESAVCEDRALAYLSELVPKLESGVSFDDTMATTFAFHAGFHPAYIWPEALVSHEKYTAVGWLGLLCRGRAALLSREVAVYLADVLERDDRGSVIVTDVGLRHLLYQSHLDLERLYTLVRKCIDGHTPVVRRGLARPVERGGRGTLVSIGPVHTGRVPS